MATNATTGQRGSVPRSHIAMWEARAAHDRPLQSFTGGSDTPAPERALYPPAARVPGINLSRWEQKPREGRTDSQLHNGDEHPSLSSHPSNE